MTEKSSCPVLRGRDDGNIILLPDHQAKALKVPENIRLIPQPPYSPELNPVEHLWEELREKYFHNLIFSSLDLLSDELCRGLNELTADKARLTSMMSFAHLNVCV